MRLAIQRLDYSRSPWRLVDLDREEFGGPAEVSVSVVFDHPDVGRTVIDEPIMGDTKAQVIQRTLDLLGALLDERARLKAKER